jgi:hypothetical protein
MHKYGESFLADAVLFSEDVTIGKNTCHTNYACWNIDIRISFRCSSRSSLSEEHLVGLSMSVSSFPPQELVIPHVFPNGRS